MGNTPEGDRRLEDRIKAVFFALLVTVVMPMLGYLWGQIQGLNKELTDYKLLVADKYVTRMDFDRGLEQLVKLMHEMRGDLRSHEEEAIRRSSRHAQ